MFADHLVEFIDAKTVKVIKRIEVELEIMHGYTDFNCHCIAIDTVSIAMLVHCDEIS